MCRFHLLAPAVTAVACRARNARPGGALRVLPATGRVTQQPRAMDPFQ